jgi:tetratricopeptide (TPR) repeat protein
MDLRVEDHPEPIKELRRLVRLRRAYNLEDAGDNAIAAKQPEEALKMYEQASSMAPDVVELQFWAAVSMYTNGREKEALALFKRVFEREPRWVPLVPRLARVGLFPDDAKKIAEVQGMAPASKSAAKPPAKPTSKPTAKKPKSTSSHH